MMPPFDIDGSRVDAMVDDVESMGKTQPVPSFVMFVSATAIVRVAGQRQKID